MTSPAKWSQVTVADLMGYPPAISHSELEAMAQSKLCLPEGKPRINPIQPPFSHGFHRVFLWFPMVFLGLINFPYVEQCALRLAPFRVQVSSAEDLAPSYGGFPLHKGKGTSKSSIIIHFYFRIVCILYINHRFWGNKHHLWKCHEISR